MKKKVMVAGHLCLDITPKFPDSVELSVDDVFTPGHLTNIRDAVLSTGGVVANTGLALDKLGVDVALNGKIGDDEFGDIIRAKVGADRAKSLKVVKGQGSSYTIVLALPGVDRFVLHNPATNDTFGPEDIDYSVVKECALFHFGYPTLMKRMHENDGIELAMMLKKVKGFGVTTSLDMAMPDPSARSGQVDWMKILEKSLPYVDIVMPSLEEITFMMDRKLFEKRKSQQSDQDPVWVYKSEDCTRISEVLISLGAKIVVIKCGIRGLYLRTADSGHLSTMGCACPEDIARWNERELWAGTFCAEKFGSALGAGDATIAGFLCGLIHGFSPDKCLQIANTVGWQNVQAVDAISGIGNWQGIIELVENKNRERNPVGIDESKWQYSHDKQVYLGPCNKV